MASSSSSSSSSRPFRFTDLPDDVQLSILSHCPPAAVARVTTLSSQLEIGKKDLPHGGDDFWIETPLPFVGKPLPRCPHHTTPTDSPAMKASATHCSCANRTFRQQIVTSYTRAADKYRRAVALVPGYAPCAEQDMLYRYQNFLDYVLNHPDAIFKMVDEDVLSDLVDLSLETNRSLLPSLLIRAAYLGHASVVEKIILSAPEILTFGNIYDVMLQALEKGYIRIVSFVIRRVPQMVSPWHMRWSLCTALQCSNFALAEHILASGFLNHENMELAVETFCREIQDHIREPTPGDTAAIEWLLRHHNLLGDGAVRKVWRLLNVATLFCWRDKVLPIREFLQRTLREALPSAHRVAAETVRAILYEIVRYDAPLTAVFMGNAFIQTLMNETRWGECLHSALHTRNMDNVSYFLERVGSLTTGDVNFRADAIVLALSIAVLMNNEPLQLRARAHLNTLLSSHPESATELLARAVYKGGSDLSDAGDQCRFLEHLIVISGFSATEFFQEVCGVFDSQIPLRLKDDDAEAEEELAEKLSNLPLFSLLHAMSPMTRAHIVQTCRTRHPLIQQAILDTVISITPKEDVEHVFNSFG